MQEALDQLKAQALASLAQAPDDAALEAWRTEVLGRNGALAQHLRSLGQLRPDLRPAAGQAANAVKSALEAAFADREQHVHASGLDARFEAERIDVTLP